MPTPKKDETESEYIGRCIPMIIKEGKTQDQAAGKCYGMWKGKENTYFQKKDLDKMELKEKFYKQDAQQIADELNIDFKDFTIEEFLKGLNVELEHKDVTAGDPIMTGKIALAHLKELPDYYDRLAIAEKQNNDKTKEVIQWNEIPISLEWKKGDTREYKDSEHKNIMQADYGYIRDTNSQDGEEMDVYLKPSSKKKTCFLISQLNPNDGTFDEFKYMLGFDDEKDAEQTYTQTMPKSMYGGINEIGWSKFMKEHLNFYKEEKQNGIKHNEKTWARPFVSCFIEPGVVSYEDSGAGIALLTKETIDKFLYTMKGRPVIIEHKENVTPRNMLDDAVGWVTDAYYEPEDGKYYCKGIIFEREAMDMVDDGCSVSCAYQVLDTKAGGTKNAVEYNEEITDGEYTHLALVDNPRYDSSYIKFNSLNKNTVKGMVLHTNNAEIRLFKNSKECENDVCEENNTNAPNIINRLETLTNAIEKLSNVFQNKLVVDEVEIVNFSETPAVENNKFNELADKIKLFNSKKNIKNQDYENLKSKISELIKKDIDKKETSSTEDEKTPEQKLTIKKVL